MDVKSKLTPYTNFLRDKPVVIGKFLTGTTASGRAAAAKRKRNVVLIKQQTKRVKRSDKKKPRKYEAVALAVAAIVRDRWYSGDPTTRMEVYDEIHARDDTAPGTEFHNKHLRAGKGPALANFLTRCLKRINFAARKNSISQVVPDTWRQDSVEASQRIRERLKDCDVIINADQTFVKMYMEAEKVLAPVATKRVGGKVNAADKKTGFTVMLAVEMCSNRVLDPFIVFTGTKMQDAKRPYSTLDYRYSYNPMSCTTTSLIHALPHPKITQHTH